MVGDTMVHILILSLEIIIVVVLILFLFRMRTRFGLTPLYITLGVLQPLQTIMAAALYIEIIPGMPVSPGSAILFTSSLFVILLIYIYEDTAEARNTVYGILAANSTMMLLFFIYGRQLTFQDTLNLFNISETVFYETSWITFLGTVILFIDAVVLLFVYEAAWRWFQKNLFPRIFTTVSIVLILDSLFFTTAVFFRQENYLMLLLSTILGKLFTAAFFTLALTIYLRYGEPSNSENKSFRDVFELLSYRQRYELEQQISMQTESLLRESEGRFETLAQISPVGIFRTDPNGVTNYVNPRWCEISGMSFDEAIGDGWLEGVHPEDLSKLTQEWESSTEENRESSAEYRFIRPDGSIAWVIGRSVPEMDDDGKIIGYAGTITDVTELKEAEAAISESEERFRNLFFASPDAIYLMDPHDPYVEWSIVDCNRAACKMSGYSHEELVGQSIYFLDVNKRTKHELVEYLETIRRHGVFTFETIQQHNDGRRYPVEITTSIVTYGGRELVLGIDRDISKRKEEEAARVKRAKELETLYQTSLEVNAHADLDSLLHAILERAATLVGVGAGSLFLMQEDGKTLKLALLFNSSDTPADVRLGLGEGITGKVAQTGEMMVIEDYQSWVHKLEILDGFDFHRFLSVPLKVQGVVTGVLNMIDRTHIGPFSEEEIRLVSLFADQAALAIENSRLYQGLQRSNIELSTAYEATIEGWSRALDLRDKETEGHTLRVTDLTLRMARAMNVSEDQMVHIRRGALLHDIGKMGVPDRILLKPDVLSEDEWEIMRKHPIYAYEMLSAVEFLRPSLEIPYCHHEKWDGSGYPRHLQGEEIPLVARIFAVVDVWDALISDRPYRPAWTGGRALEFIRRQAGKHFDPEVVSVFLDLIGPRTD